MSAVYSSSDIDSDLEEAERLRDAVYDVQLNCKLKTASDNKYSNSQLLENRCLSNNNDLENGFQITKDLQNYFKQKLLSSLDRQIVFKKPKRRKESFADSSADDLKVPVFRLFSTSVNITFSQVNSPLTKRKYEDTSSDEEREMKKCASVVVTSDMVLAHSKMY